ncbi:MAG: DUF2029 domain-containing protein [Kiritimatiellae bacterium]|nr:DUF2029 domain-containing protein [Kiritimatiellia bacterium]
MRSRVVAIATAVLFLLAVAFFLWQMTRPGWGFDFRLRYNELTCLRAGVDPFLVWSGKAEIPGLKPYTNEAIAYLLTAGAHSFVHTYTPWTYTLLYPFALLAYPAALACWRLVLSLCFALLLLFAYRTAHRVRGKPTDGLLALAAVSAYVSLNFENGVALNFGLLLAVAVCTMGWFLNRGRELAAGVCLALLMMKPQIGALFTLPLLLQRRYKTLAAGAVLCLAGTLPPALLCHRSPLDLILQVLQAGVYTRRTTFFPGCVYAALSRHLCAAVPFAVSALLGAALCVWLCWRLRNERDNLLVLSAPAIVCVAWTYSTIHDRLVYALPIILLVCAFCQERDKKIRAALFALLLFLPFAVLYQYFCWLIPNVPPSLIRASFIWHSAHELLSLFLLAGFCLWLSRDPFRKEAA